MVEVNVKLLGASCVEGKKLNILISVRDYINNEWVEVSIPREEFTPQIINKVIVNNNGICQNAKAVCKGLMKEFENSLLEGKLKVVHFHERLGWNCLKGKTVFYGKNAISVNDEVESLYCGEIGVEQTGTVEKLAEMIRTQIISQEEWSPLEAVIAFGVGATVLSYANEVWNSSMNNLIIHLLGGSSTGKSSSLSLFVGLGSNPNPKKGYWINYGSSEVSVIKRIGNNNGYPVALDELSEGKSKEYSSLVYAIGNGEEKDRLMPGGDKFRDSATFQTIVLSSGELSLIKKCSKDGGIRARCIELTNIYWTKSKEQSIIIKECMKKNYGLITPLVARELINNDTKWRERWGYWKQQVDDRFEKDAMTLSVSIRIADYVALFALATEIANEVLDIMLDVNEIFKFCYENIIIANEEDGNISTRAYSAIVEYISLNKERFADATFISGCRSQYNDITLSVNEDGFFHNTRKRIIEGKEYDSVYVFRESTLENILADAGFSDYKVTRFKLKEAGYLKIKDKKRCTYTYTINGSSQNCVAVYFRDETMDGCEIDDN